MALTNTAPTLILKDGLDVAQNTAKLKSINIYVHITYVYNVLHMLCSNALALTMTLQIQCTFGEQIMALHKSVCRGECMTG